MHSRGSDEDRCPVCGQTFAKLVVLKKPADWRDFSRKRPVDYFLQYERRCSAQRDVEEERDVGPGEVAVYFHEGRCQPSIM